MAEATRHSTHVRTNLHPGEVDAALDKHIAIDKKKTEVMKKQDKKAKAVTTKVKRLAQIERQIAEEDLLDNTPQAPKVAKTQPKPRQCSLSSSLSSIQDVEEQAPTSRPETEVEEEEAPTSTSQPETADEGEADSEEAKPKPKLKSKSNSRAPKQTIRDAISEFQAYEDAATTQVAKSRLAPNKRGREVMPESDTDLKTHPVAKKKKSSGENQGTAPKGKYMGAKRNKDEVTTDVEDDSTVEATRPDKKRLRRDEELLYVTPKPRPKKVKVSEDNEDNMETPKPRAGRKKPSVEPDTEVETETGDHENPKRRRTGDKNDSDWEIVDIETNGHAKSGTDAQVKTMKGKISKGPEKKKGGVEPKGNKEADRVTAMKPSGKKQMKALSDSETEGQLRSKPKPRPVKKPIEVEGSDDAQPTAKGKSLDDKGKGRQSHNKPDTATSAGGKSTDRLHSEEAGKPQFDVAAWAKDIDPSKQNSKRKSLHIVSTSTPSLAGKSQPTAASTKAPSTTRSALKSTVRVKADNGVGDDEGEEMQGLSDHDEVDGDEADRARNSPVKGKKVRATSTSLVAVTTRQRRARNEDLPAECHHGNAWCSKAIPTMYAFVASGGAGDIWAVDDHRLRDGLQIICRYLYGDLDLDLEDTDIKRGRPSFRESVAFRLVTQRLSDWRCTIGSAGILAVISYFEDPRHQGTFTTDEARKAFAVEQLDKYRFLFKTSEGDDQRKFKGIFQGPFCPIVFAAHLNATMGAVIPMGLYPGNKLPPVYGAVGLIAASIERSLTLWAQGNITIAAIAEAKKSKRAIQLEKIENPTTGVVSHRPFAFAEVGWGSATRGFTKSAQKNLTLVKFEALMTAAKQFEKVTRRTTSDPQSQMTETGSDDERACLAEGSSDDLDED